MPAYCTVVDERCVLNESDMVVIALQNSELNSASTTISQLSGHCSASPVTDCLLTSKICEPDQCNDHNPLCASWGSSGDCTGNDAERVQILCPQTCGTCVLTEVGCRGRPWGDWVDCEAERSQCPHNTNPNPVANSLCPYTCVKDLLLASGG